MPRIFNYHRLFPKIRTVNFSSSGNAPVFKVSFKSPSLPMVRKFSSDELKNDGDKDKPKSPKNQVENKSGVTSTVKEATITAAEAIALATKYYTQEVNRAYSDMETLLMDRIHESNTRRFRMILLSVTVGLFWIIAFFGSRIKKMLTEQTADLARETLENESLQIQTQALARAVVQTILNDKEVMTHAAGFLRDASGAAETQAALLKLTLHVLQHPASITELTALVKKVIAVLSQDKETVRQLASLLSMSLQDSHLQRVISEVIQQLCRDPEILKSLSEATVHVIQTPEVQQATLSLLSSSSLQVLEDKEVVDQARDFVTDVVGDDRLQREGGNAIWNSVSHAIRPGLVRLTGITLLALSIGVVRVVLSPF